MPNPDPSSNRWRAIVAPLVFLSGNWISQTGVFLVSAAGVSWLFLLPHLVSGIEGGPYLGLLTFFLLPLVFFLGLLLIPAGIVWTRHRRRVRGTLPSIFPAISFDQPAIRQLVIFIAVATMVNVLIAGQLTTGAMHYMEGAQFCGQTCHTPMRPEYTAYTRGPHSHVACASCHIAPGPVGFATAKLRGMNQLVGVITGDYARPIPAPVQTMPDANQVCLECHSPNLDVGDVLRVVPSYAEDATNTLTETVLLVHVGSGASGRGIHGAHLAAGVSIRYAYSGDKREDIRRIEYSNAGRTTVYTASDKPAAEGLATRPMDCMDCHNRPAHTFEMPGRALDAAFSAGSIPADLPFAKKEAMQLLKADYASHEEAARQIPAQLAAFYQSSQPGLSQTRRSDIARMGQIVAAIYAHNVFPDMKVTWGTHANFLGHTDAPGCFRCHDDRFKATAGRAMGQDCGTCHNLIAMDESSPKILSGLGLAPEPPAEGKGPGGKGR